MYIFAGMSISNALNSVTMSPSEAQYDLAALNDTSSDFLQPERCRQPEVRNAVVDDPFDRHRLLLVLIAMWICKYYIISGVTCGTQMIKNPSDATVRRIMKENDVVQSAIQLANSGYTKRGAI